MRNDAVLARDASRNQLEREEKEVYAERKRRETELQKVKKEAEEKKILQEARERRLVSHVMFVLFVSAERKFVWMCISHDAVKFMFYNQYLFMYLRHTV